MDIQFNRNEDAMKLSLTEMRKRLHKIYEGGGKKSIEKQPAFTRISIELCMKASIHPTAAAISYRDIMAI